MSKLFRIRLYYLVSLFQIEMLRYILRQNYSKDMVGSVLGIQKGGRKDGSGSSSGIMTLPLFYRYKCCLKSSHNVLSTSSKQLPCKYELENEFMVLYDFDLAEFLDQIHFNADTRLETRKVHDLLR